MFNFEGQNVIVTGGTRGIGRAVAEAFLKAGAVVIVTFGSDENAASDFEMANASYKDRIDIRKFDVADPSKVQDFFNYVDEKYGTVHVLVNNSGIRRDAVLAMMKEEDWDRVIDVNLSGVYRMSKFAVMNMMRNRYGRIINITSPSGKLGFAGQANYAASKAGQVALARSLSKEVATRGITVNCVSPGFIDTGFIKDLSEKQKESYLKTIPLRRFGKPEDISPSVLFLATREAEYITGATIEVTGGL